MLAFLNFNPMEIGIVAIIAVLLFGKRIPEIARSLGSSITEFKKGVQGITDVRDEVHKEVRSITDDIRRNPEVGQQERGSR